MRFTIAATYPWVRGTETTDVSATDVRDSESTTKSLFLRVELSKIIIKCNENDVLIRVLKSSFPGTRKKKKTREDGNGATERRSADGGSFYSTGAVSRRREWDGSTGRGVAVPRQRRRHDRDADGRCNRA